MKINHRVRIRMAAWLVLVCGAQWVPGARGQTTYGSLVGNTSDPSGAAMPAVTVTVMNEGTGESSRQMTNDLGGYAFTTLYPGSYSLHAEKAGFRAIDIRNIRLEVNQTARYDLAMEVGQVVQTVEITASAPVLATDSADLGNVVTDTQIKDLPLNGRNYMQLASLTNGVILTGSRWSVESGGPTFLSEGGRPTQNSFLVDGVETRTQREGGYGLNLSIDAIQEFKVLQNSFDAEQGRGTTIVNAVVRPGTNTFHGTVFEFVRNDKFDARNAFDLTGIKPPLRLNQFGGSLGGPIRRDKTFFFFDYEGQRVRTSSTSFTNVPTPAMLGGNLSGTASATDPSTGQPFAGNQISSTRFSTFAQAAIPYYPAPNSTLLPNLNYQAIISNPTDMNQAVARIDHDLSSRDRLSGHLVFFRYWWAQPGVLPYSGQAGHSYVSPNLEAEWTHSFSPNLLNVARFGYSHTTTLLGYDKIAGQDLTGTFGLKNLRPEPNSYAPPQVNISGFGSIGAGAWIPNGALDLARQFGDQLSYVKGRHTIKAGADLRFLRYNDLGYATQNGYYDFRGIYTGNAFADFLLGMPQDAFADQSGGHGFSLPTTNSEFSFYGQDSIRLTRELTVNAGLRYEIVQYPKEDHNEFASWNFQRGALDFAGKQLPARMVPTDLDNWGPRLGIAWTPSFLRKTVIRTGAGITYGNFRQWEVALLHFNPPFVFDNFQFNSLPNPTFTTATLWPAVNTDLSTIDFRNVTVNYQNPNKDVPVTYQWNFDIQHELAPNLLLEVGYAGNRGIHQPNRYDANQASAIIDLANPTPIQSRRPYQNVGFVSGNESNAWSNYNALDIRLERRFSKGLELLGVYTYAKAMGIRAWDNWTVMDLNDIRRNYGPVNDYAHIATVSYIYELPFGPGKRFLAGAEGVLGHVVGGWEVNGITTFSSGGSLDLYSSVSTLLGNRAGNTPNRIGNGNFSSGQRNAGRWFDKTAFVDPPVGRYGNAGTGVIRGPGNNSWDLSLFKNIPLNERQTTLQFRCEMFNAFNHVNLSNPSTWTSDPSFGRITSANAAREIQLGLKLLF